MKEFYIAPEAEIICFAPVEKLASELGVDWLNGGSGESGKEIYNPETTNPNIDGEITP